LSEKNADLVLEISSFVDLSLHPLVLLYLSPFFNGSKKIPDLIVLSIQKKM